MTDNQQICNDKRALKNATVHVDGQVAVLKGAEKDHKESVGKIRMRPIENAMDGPIKNISEVYSDVLSGIVESKNDGVLCSSTEELLERFESDNKNSADIRTEKRIAASMDSVSLYTNLEAEASSKIVRGEVIHSDVKFENFDVHEMRMYLRIHLESEHIKEKGYDDILPQK